MLQVPTNKPLSNIPNIRLHIYICPPQAVCLLRSCRRTFLFSLNFMAAHLSWSDINVNYVKTSSHYEQLRCESPVSDEQQF